MSGLFLLIAVSATEGLELRKVISDEAYEAYRKELDPESLDLPKALAEKRPPYGSFVQAVEAGGQAARAGIEVGWVVESYNGKILADHTLGMDPGGPDGKMRRVVAWSPAGEVKTVDFDLGKIGFTRSNWIHPEMFVLRQIPRGAWDQDMLVAAEAWIRGRHDIAETALSKAQDAGMPDNGIARFHRALLAMDRGEDQEARSLWGEFMKDLGGGEIPPYYRGGVRTYAWHYRDFPLLRRAVEIDAFMPGRVQPATIDDWAKQAKGQGDPLLPLKQPPTGKDLMPTVVTIPDDVWKKWKLIPAKFLHQGWTAVPGTPGQSMSYHFMPQKPVKNVLWEITMAVGNAGPPLERQANSVVLALMDRSQTGGDAPSIEVKRVMSFSAIEHADGMRWVGFGGGIQGGTLYTQQAIPWMSAGESAAISKAVDEQRRAKPPADRIVKLALIRIGNQAELTVNGVTWSRMFVPDAVHDLGFFFQVVGTAVVIDHMTLHSLDD